MGQDPPKPKHDHAALKFPEGFLWGAATSSYQVEGGNIHADWESFKSAGLACDQYHLYEKDFELAQKLGHNAHRLSIEWSRIEPQEGHFDEKEIEHYVKLLKYLKSLNMQVMLTLWHFTLPQWVADQGGWEASQTVKYFLRFLEKVVPELKDWVDLWITINEPGVYTFMAYMGGSEVGPFPPAKKSNLAALKVTWNLAQAHKKAYMIIHKIIPHSQVGIAQNITTFDSFHKHSLRELIAVGLSDIVANHSFYFLTKSYHDFLGLNYYFHYRFNLKKGFVPEIVNPGKNRLDISDLGWEIYPEGLFNALTDMSDDLPIYITEAGIASTNDDRRTRFLINFLQETYRAIQAGVKVKGFFYWSLLDVFEWERGFNARFGLVEVDFKTQKRIVRPSAHVFEEIIKRNAIPHDLLKLLGHGIRVEDVLKEKIEE